MSLCLKNRIWLWKVVVVCVCVCGWMFGDWRGPRAADALHHHYDYHHHHRPTTAPQSTQTNVSAPYLPTWERERSRAVLSGSYTPSSAMMRSPFLAKAGRVEETDCRWVGRFGGTCARVCEMA